MLVPFPVLVLAIGHGLGVDQITSVESTNKRERKGESEYLMTSLLSSLPLTTLDATRFKHSITNDSRRGPLKRGASMDRSLRLVCASLGSYPIRNRCKVRRVNEMMENITY